MKPLLMISLAAIALFTTTNSNAAGNFLGVEVLVERIYLDGPNYFITFDAQGGNPDGCTATGANLKMAVMPSSLTYRETYISLAITAMAAQKPVTAWVSGCQATNWGFTVPIIAGMGASR